MTGSKLQKLDSQSREQLIQRAEAEFSQLVRRAVEARKFGHFGLIVSVQAGWIKTLERRDVETLK